MAEPPRGGLPLDILRSGGRLIGRPGRSDVVWMLSGGEPAACALLEVLAYSGSDVTPSGYPGEMRRLPDGSTVGFRPPSKSAPPTIDINIEGFRVRKLKFEVD
ncbi:MAG: hypothetical protein AB7F35_17775 [Acetobacteraceae bacterium]